MRPVLQDNKLSPKLIILYTTILIVCIIGIVVALHAQFSQENNISISSGGEIEEDDRNIGLKEEFDRIFTNDIEVAQGENINIQKLNGNFDIIVTAYTYKKDEENAKINVNIPYLNINDASAKQLNSQIKTEFKDKAEMFMNQISSINIIYSVEYKAFVQNNILSLAIRSEFKEGEKSQKILMQTFNYNLVEKREVPIEEILGLKNITKDEANNKIKEEIKRIQEENQGLIDEGYELYERDYTSSIYDISNSKQYFYGKDGMLYVIYAYGNDADTSEMDIIIF